MQVLGGEAVCSPAKHKARCQFQLLLHVTNSPYQALLYHCFIRFPTRGGGGDSAGPRTPTNPPPPQGASGQQ